MGHSREQDKILAEAIGDEPINYECDDPNRCPYEEETNPGACATCKHEVPVYRSYSSDDHAALDGLKMLRKKGIGYYICDDIDGLTLWLEELDGDVLVESRQNPGEGALAAAFADAVTEKAVSVSTSETIPGTELPKAEAMYRIKPALRELLKDGEERY